MGKIKLPKDIQHIFKVKWSHHAARSGATFIFSYVHLLGYINFYPKFIGDRFWYVIVQGGGSNWVMWRNKEDLERLRNDLAERVNNIDYVRKAFKKMKKSIKRYRLSGDELKKINFEKLTNQQLAKIFIDYYFNTPIGTGAASTLIELVSAFGMNIERELNIINEKKRKDIMMLISSPSKIALPLEEEINFLKLVIDIDKQNINKLSKNLISRLRKHFNSYQWLSVYIDDEPWTREEFIERLKKEQKEGKTEKKLLELKQNLQKTEKQIKGLIKEYNLDKKRIDLLREMMFYRIQVENFYSYVNYFALNLKKEVARRLHISLEQLRYLLPEEVSQALLGKRISFEDRIDERKKNYLMIVGRKKVYIAVGERAGKVFSLLSKETEIKENIKEIKGICGQPGKIQGRAKVVLSVRELDKIEDGDILITQNTTPIFVPAMKKAAAIITDEGGITCHAAIVARELNIPCIIGTKIATKVLKDGQLVEVDANKGIVRIIK